jgi:hypothetical protein
MPQPITSVVDPNRGINLASASGRRSASRPFPSAQIARKRQGSHDGRDVEFAAIAACGHLLAADPQPFGLKAQCPKKKAAVRRMRLQRVVGGTKEVIREHDLVNALDSLHCMP